MQLFDPVDRVFLHDLADSANSFSFLLPKPRKPVFGNNRVEFTRKAADSFASVFKNSSPAPKTTPAFIF